MDIKTLISVAIVFSVLFWLIKIGFQRLRRASSKGQPLSFLWVYQTSEELVKISSDISLELRRNNEMKDLDQVESFLNELERLIVHLHTLKNESFITQVELEDLAYQATALMQRGKKIHGMLKK